jgi:heat shock protein 1/8
VKAQEDISENSRAVELLCIACEQAKGILFSSTQASIEIDHLYEGIDFYYSITKAQLEGLNVELICGELDPAETGLRNAI